MLQGYAVDQPSHILVFSVSGVDIYVDILVAARFFGMLIKSFFVLCSVN